MAQNATILKYYPVIVDMTEEMAKQAQEIAIRAFEGSCKESQVAAAIQNEFNKSFGILLENGTMKSCWNVIVGRSYGSSVTHEAKKYINFQVGNFTVVIWKV